MQVGLGLIGGTVIEQIIENRARWRDEGLDIGVAAILTTGGALLGGAEGFSDDQLRTIVARRHAGPVWRRSAKRSALPAWRMRISICAGSGPNSQS